MGKKKVSRLFDLDVSEVSLVDKPAIEEEFIVTKSVDGKKVKSTDDVEGAPATTDSNEADRLDTSLPSDLAGSRGDGSQETKPEHGVQKVMDEELKKIQKDMSAMQESLGEMLALHELAAITLNTIVGLCAGAYSAACGAAEPMMDEPQKATVLELRKSLTTIVEDKDAQKVGAKISAERLNALKEIAEKLTALIATVSQQPKKADEDTQAAAKKVDDEIDAVKEQVKALQAQAEESKKALEKSSEDLKKANGEVEALTKRLGDMENSSSASTTVSDDDTEASGTETQPKGKSVFSGLFDVEDIKKRTRQPNVKK